MDHQGGGVWVVAEQRHGDLQTVSLELLGKARELAGGSTYVAAVLMGHGVRDLTQILIKHGAELVLVADDPELEPYRLLPYAFVLNQIMREYKPDVLLMGATAMGTELAPRVAAKTGTGLAAHCIDLKLDKERRLLQVVPGWGGGVVATVVCPERRPQIATVMPGAMKVFPAEEREGKVREVKLQVKDENLGPKVIEVKQEKPKGLPLEKAEVVVAGGRGIGTEENWKMIEDLANLLGGAVGATRPPVDELWTAEDRMIGQSGKTVHPKLYIGVGISGAMHHVVGMDQSEHIITINIDPGAEIFETSDVIVVKDFKKILPLLIQELNVRLGR